MNKVVLLIVTLCMYCMSAFGQDKWIRAEYYFDSDPGVGKGINIPITSSATADSISESFSADIATLKSGFHTVFIRVLRQQSSKYKWSLFDARTFYVTKPKTAEPDPSLTNAKSEYYIDTDPGVGKGTPITGTTNIDTLVSITDFQVPISSLKPGFHNIAVRTKANGGRWSLVDCRTFYITSPKPAVKDQSLTSATAEYFIDKDPASGKGTTITGLTLKDTSASITDFQVPVSSLSYGFHNIAVRVKSNGGDWSHFEYRTFYIPKPQVLTTPKIVAAEYFIDADTGQGKGFKLIDPNGTYDSITFQHDLTLPPKLKKGFHNIAVRVKNDLGIWSHFEYRTFYIAPSPAERTQPKLVYAEMSVDKDLGPGKGSYKKTFTPSDTITFPSQDIALDTFALGTHKLFFRVRDELGRYSFTKDTTFIITNCKVYPRADFSLSAVGNSQKGLCQKDTAFFINNTTGGDAATKYEWNFNGDAIVDDTTKGNTKFKYTLPVNGQSPYQDYKVVLKVSNGPTCFTKDSLIIRIQDPGTASFTINNDSLFAKSAGTYQWYDDAGLIPFATQQVYAPTKSGNYYLVTSNGYGCNSAPSAPKAYVPSVATASIEAIDAVINQGDSTSFVITFSGTGPWKVYLNKAGSQQVKTISTTTYTVFAKQQGAYKVDSVFDASNKKGKVFGVATVTWKTVQGAPSATTVSQDYEINTSGDTAKVTIRFTGKGPWQLNYSYEGINKTLSTSDSIYVFKLIQTGRYVLIGVVDSKNVQGVATGVFNVKYKQLGGNSTATTITKNYELAGYTDTAKVAVSVRGSGPWTLYYTFEGVMQKPLLVKDTAYVLRVIQPGNYQLNKILDVNGSLGTVSGSFSVSYKEIGTSSVTISGVDTLIGLDTAYLLINLKGAGPWTVFYKINGYTYPNPLYIKKDQSPYVLKATIVGNYTLDRAFDAFGKACTIGGKGVVFRQDSLAPSYKAIVEGGGSLNDVDSVLIRFTYDGNIPWTLVYTNGVTVDTVEDITSNEYLIKVANKGNYKILQIIDLKATSNPKIEGLVEVNLEIETREAYSPNSDGINDNFIIKGLKLYKVNQLFVYTREGKGIFQSDNYLNDWKGQDMDGKDIPDGVYFYTLKSSEPLGADKPTQETTGYIEIRR